MSISESQLEIWSHQGSTTQSSDTYNKIKDVLKRKDAPYAGKNYEVFLQGSYGNDTNIRAESDVDIVIRLNDVVEYEMGLLSKSAGDASHQAHDQFAYNYPDFKSDVLKVLSNKYGAAVKSGNKAISVEASGSRRKADVIVACLYRRQRGFLLMGSQEQDEGIFFFDAYHRKVVNYPKQHSVNLTKKHQNVMGRLKPLIRIFKNFRKHLADNGRIRADIAPSYYIENLLYNMPDEKFASGYCDCLENALIWYQSDARNGRLVCANGQYDLFGADPGAFWNRSDCDEFVGAVLNCWHQQ